MLCTASLYHCPFPHIRFNIKHRLFLVKDMLDSLVFIFLRISEHFLAFFKGCC